MALTHEQVVVDCDVLRSDAKKWLTAADDMQGAAGAGAGLVMGVDKFGASQASADCQSSYTALQRKLAGLLGQAGTELRKVATVLRSAADTYEQEDTAGAHSLAPTGG